MGGTGKLAKDDQDTNCKKKNLNLWQCYGTMIHLPACPSDVGLVARYLTTTKYRSNMGICAKGEATFDTQRQHRPQWKTDLSLLGWVGMKVEC